MSRRTSLLAAVLVVAACGGTSADSSTTSTSTSLSTTSTTVATTTTTEAPVEECEPTPLEGRGWIWEAGCTYTASSFLVPITFAGAEGWSSVGAAFEFAALKYDADADGGSDATLTIFAYDVESKPPDILDDVLVFDGVDAISERTAITLAGVPAITLDVDGAPLDSLPGTSSGCTEPVGTAFFYQTTESYTLLELPLKVGQGAFGIPACFRSRVWVLAVEGWSITAIGVTRDVEHFEELMPILQEFLENNVTFGDAGG